MKRVGRVILGLLVALICAGGLLVASWHVKGASEHARFKSPDGCYELVVFRHPTMLAMPGQASDAPGTILLTTAEGRELERTSVSKVQLVSTPRWEKDKVSMKFLCEWPRRPD